MDVGATAWICAAGTVGSQPYFWSSGVIIQKGTDRKRHPHLATELALCSGQVNKTASPILWAELAMENGTPLRVVRRVYFFSEISIVARVFSQSRYMWQPLPISWKEMVKSSTGAAVLETLMS